MQNETQIRKAQKVVENNAKLEVKNFPKNIKQPIIQQRKSNKLSCPSCKKNNWLEFEKGYYCKNCGYIINKQKHPIHRKVLRQDRDFSYRLNYANKKLREIWMNMGNTTYNSTEKMIDR